MLHSTRAQFVEVSGAGDGVAAARLILPVQDSREVAVPTIMTLGLHVQWFRFCLMKKGRKLVFGSLMKLNVLGFNESTGIAG